MAKPPVATTELNALYGPHPNFAPPGGWERSAERRIDKLVKTHCSFCGMQCGIQLKVRDNQVIGFEPWEEFPFNRGMLCPKGVKRYLQGVHPDRLLYPLLRTETGFQQIRYEEALAHYRVAYDVTKNPALLYNMGRAYEGLADFPKALDALEEFVATASPELKGVFRSSMTFSVTSGAASRRSW